MKVHELKSWPEPFNALRLGYRTAEYRVNDRDYHEGDLLVIRCWDNVSNRLLSRPPVIATVTHVDTEFLPDGYCVLSFRKLK